MQHAVGVLLRVDDPDHQVGERDDALDLDAMRRARRSRSRAGRAGRARRARPRAGAAAGPRASRAARRRRRPRRPRSPSRWSAGDGSRARARRPASALKSVDLPAPVGPASATTVASTPSPSRRPARGDDGLGRVDGAVVEPPARELGRLGERREPAVERPPAHRRALARSSAARLVERSSCAGRRRDRRRARARSAAPRRRAASARAPSAARARAPRACAPPGRRRSPRAPSGRAPTCRRRRRPRRR